MRVILVVLLITMTTQLIAGDNHLFKDNLFTDGDIITEKDFSTFESVVFLRETQIVWYDGRKITANGWNKSTFKVFVFTAKFLRGNDIKIRVNTEFKTKSKAEEQALKYAKLIGMLPNFLRTKNLKTLTIQRGSGMWGGNNDIIIGTDLSVERKYLEEILMHESSHSTLDPKWEGSVNRRQWNAAAKSDNKFISKYAEDFPKREDIAETINWWVAVRCKPDTISKKHYEQINEAIPNRLKYLDEQNYDTYPLVCGKQFNSTEIGQDFKKLNETQRINIQIKLKSLGLYDSSIDGVFGRNTSKAIEAFIKESYGKENFTFPLNSDKIFQSILMLKL